MAMKTGLKIAKHSFSLAFALGTMLLVVGFCLITNTAGDRRVYLNANIPLTIQLNSSVPSNYIPPIQASIQTWNDVPSSYWQFALGANTSASTVAADGVNLLYFDLAGTNFPPPTSVIAFSSTFTSSSGGYHATESDLIWNARDFPPSPVGAGGQQDLQSVVTHELGHHLGLDHTGLPAGATSGCGPQVQPATMWWSSSNGDTTKRSLHLEDITGVSVLYPSWKLQGTVMFNSSPASAFPLWFRQTKVSTVGPVENPIGTRYNRSGYLLDTLYTDINGQYSTIVIDQTFDIIAYAFGYERDSIHIQFDPPGGTGQTQIITRNIQITQTPMATISGTVRNAVTLAPIQARVQLYGKGDPNGLTATVTSQANGSYSVNVPSKEQYRVVVSLPAPYVDTVVADVVFLPTSGTSLTHNVVTAQALLVDDDAGASYQTSYQSSLARLNLPYRTLSIADSSATLSTVLSAFSQKPLLLWFTGSDTTNSLTFNERRVIIDHLNGRGKAIITGQNIAQFSPPGDSLLNNYLGIQFTGNTTALNLRGFAGDIIGNGVNYLITGGPGPQTSKDVLSLVGGSIGTPTPTLYYLSGSDSSQFAGVRVLGPNARWGVTYFALGLEGFSPARQDTFIVRSMRYFNQSVTSVPGVSPGGVPNEYTLAQNYPNPFNPTTQITFGLPQESHVTLTLYNSLGQEVIQLIDGEKSAGYYTVRWTGMNSFGAHVASGVYLYKLQARSTMGKLFIQTKKLILVR